MECFSKYGLKESIQNNEKTSDSRYKEYLGIHELNNIGFKHDNVGRGNII